MTVHLFDTDVDPSNQAFIDSFGCHNRIKESLPIAKCSQTKGPPLVRARASLEAAISGAHRTQNL
jgi:hypothetical protein